MTTEEKMNKILKDKKLQIDIHPGVLISSALIMGISDDIGISKNELVKLLNGKLNVNKELSEKLGKFFNLDEKYFYELQRKYDSYKSISEADLIC